MIQNLDYRQMLVDLRGKAEKESLNRKEVMNFKIAWLNNKIAEKALCDKCKFKPGDTVDHIIPKVVLMWFGIDATIELDEDNFQIMCKFCNHQKGFSLDFSNPKTKPLLIKCLERV